MSQHIGDMENLETLDARLRAVDHMQAIFRITPTAVACDLHPGYPRAGAHATAGEASCHRRAAPSRRTSPRSWPNMGWTARR
ncbi:MAG: hypothetical protein R3A10_01255 [Caldilineaceae bacterium]